MNRLNDLKDAESLERELLSERALRRQAQAESRAKDMLLVTVGHELRTPLNAIRGWTEILRRESLPMPDAIECLDAIERNCGAQAQLIEELLDLSSIRLGKLRLQLEAWDLAIVILAAVEAVRPAAEMKRIKIDVSIDPTSRPRRCDERRIRQVVCNLLSNAIKFSPSGTTVRVSLNQAPSSSRIKVCDEGRGISSDFLPYVFDEFRQDNVTDHENAGGLGLGLHIVKQIVSAHGGTIQAQSAGVGRGACFTVDLPDGTEPRTTIARACATSSC